MAHLVLMTKPTPPRDGPLAKRAITHARATLASLRSWRAGPRGPQAVVASLTRGLACLGVGFDLNPRRLPDGTVLGVLSDLGALAQAIEWRRQGNVARLIAGPNLVVLPSDAPELMSTPEIDLCIVPSSFVKENYEQDCPALRDRLAIWPAGVDCTYWSPVERSTERPRRALVFRKAHPEHVHSSDEELEAACQLLRSHGFTVTTLEYGSFSRRVYRHALRGCDLSIVFGIPESQGIALSEAWSVDVPTLVCAREQSSYRGRPQKCSAAPYLSAETGAFFRNLDELESLVANWERLSRCFKPRSWVLRNMSDEICARSYCRLVQDGGAQASTQFLSRS